MSTSNFQFFFNFSTLRNRLIIIIIIIYCLKVSFAGRQQESYCSLQVRLNDRLGTCLLFQTVSENMVIARHPGTDNHVRGRVARRLTRQEMQHVSQGPTAVPSTGPSSNWTFPQRSGTLLGCGHLYSPSFSSGWLCNYRYNSYCTLLLPLGS